jgi:hypothetical protein
LNDYGNPIVEPAMSSPRSPSLPAPPPLPSPQPKRAEKAYEPRIPITAKSVLGIGLGDAITLERPKGTPQSAEFKRTKLSQLEELQASHTYFKNRTFEQVKPQIDDFLSDFAEDGRIKERLSTCDIPVSEERWRDYITNLLDVIRHIPDKTTSPGCHIKYTRGGKRSKTNSKTHTRKNRK